MSPTSMDRWEHFPHDADIGIRGIGSTKEAAFEQAALALIAVMLPPGEIAFEREVEIRCEAPGDELLLADWLNALVYEMAARRLIFGRFELRLQPGRLDARAWGQPVERLRNRPAVEVKGATYAELSVRREQDGSWVAQCVTDV